MQRALNYGKPIKLCEKIISYIDRTIVTISLDSSANNLSKCTAKNELPCPAPVTRAVFPLNWNVTELILTTIVNSFCTVTCRHIETINIIFSSFHISAQRAFRPQADFFLRFMAGLSKVMAAFWLSRKTALTELRILPK